MDRDSKEIGMMFKDILVKAILEGNKTQTRRMIKNPPAHVIKGGFPLVGDDRYCFFDNKTGKYIPIPTPYHVGDKIWVRETFAIVRETLSYEYNEYAVWDWEKELYGDPRPHLNQVSRMGRIGSAVFYKAQDEDDLPAEFWEPNREIKWRPSIHTPRWASRILLEITDVRVEQLKDITNEDALAEGVTERDGYYCMDWTQFDEDPSYNDRHPKTFGNDGPRGAFFTYFDKISGLETWKKDVNPWLWVIDFKVVRVTS